MPYPNTGMASDTTSGSKTVKLHGKEAMLRNKSYFKKSTGDEAATPALKKGVLTSQIQGKVYFNSWSMDVKIEGENVVRHLDLTTHNHGSIPGNTPTWPYLASIAVSVEHPCHKDIQKERDACQKHEVYSKKGKLNKAKTKTAQCNDPDCQTARKCMLVPYKPNSCCEGQTGHHLIEVHGFCERGDRGVPLSQWDGSNGKKPYDLDKAPVVCALCPRGSRYYQEHGDLHAVQGIKENAAIANAPSLGRKPDYAWNYGEAKQAGVDAHSATFPDSGCNEDCIAMQLDNYHKNEVGAKDGDPMRTEEVKFKKDDPDQQQRGRDLIQALETKRGNLADGM